MIQHQAHWTSELIHIVIHTLSDTVYLIPFLFLTYLFLEYLEHHTQSKIQSFIQKTEKFGSLWGALAGLVSGCGISATATNFYVTKIITLGTLISVYLATSDEMLPLMIVQNVPAITITKIIVFKVIYAVLIGFLIDFYCRKKNSKPDFKELCNEQNCCCCQHGILKPALYHTIQIISFVILISFLLNLVLHQLKPEEIATLFSNYPILSIFVASFIGLIPNCAISVGLTQLYIKGFISVGVLLAGLFSNAGVGLIVLLKLRSNPKELLKICGILYLCGIIGGFLALFLFS